MQTFVTDEMVVRSEILADALADTIAELRLIDAGDMIAYVRAGQWANIADLVQSSSELSFRDGALTFGYSAAFEVSWGAAPSIALDMELQTTSVTVFFTLTLAPAESTIAIGKILFASAQESEAAATRLFAQALHGARRPA